MSFTDMMCLYLCLQRGPLYLLPHLRKAEFSVENQHESPTHTPNTLSWQRKCMSWWIWAQTLVTRGCQLKSLSTRPPQVWCWNIWTDLLNVYKCFCSVFSNENPVFRSSLLIVKCITSYTLRRDGLLWQHSVYCVMGDFAQMARGMLLKWNNHKTLSESELILLRNMETAKLQDRCTSENASLKGKFWPLIYDIELS